MWTGVLTGRGKTECALPGVAVIVAVSMLAAGPSNAASSSSVLTSMPNPSGSGETATFTATIKASGGGAPSGTVTFKDGAVTLGSVAVDVTGVGFPVAGGRAHSCALTAVGGVQCWGDNEYGQLGNNDAPTDQSVPAAVSGLASGVSAVATGYFFGCALTDAGGVKCWGRNDNGELGDGTTTSSPIPVDVTGLTSGVVTVSTGGYHACAVTDAGAVKCWGKNTVGQLGDGSTTGSQTPVDVSGLTGGIAAVATGFAHSCALTDGGAIKCWGYNTNGQLGIGNKVQQTTPTDALFLTSGVASISAGFYHTCAVTDDGAAKCWGYNLFYQLGNNTTASYTYPTDVSGLSSGVSTMVAGQDHTCALLDTGGAKCWGANNSGQLGDGTTTQRRTPANVSGLSSGVSAIAAGTKHTCALKTDGSAVCWGNNSDGQVGDNSTTQRPSPTAVSGLGAGSTLIYGRTEYATAALAGGAHPITAEYVGDGDPADSATPVHRHIVKAAVATSLATSVNPGTFGETVTFTATVAGHANGAAGGTVVFKDGATTLGSSGLAAVGAESRLASGNFHNCALTTAGGVKCWGSNSDGQIGDGSFDQRNTPVDVNGLASGLRSVAVGSYHTCALTPVGGVKCWGANDAGQLGNGSTNDSSLPVDVSGLAGDVRAITAGNDHTCALTGSGGILCWGGNTAGELGNGTTNNSLVPVAVSGLSGVRQVSAGRDFTCALTAVGGAKCWGWGIEGRLGTGTTTSRSTPVDVSSLTSGVAAISAGNAHACALTDAGAVKCWGRNANGQLGDGSKTQRNTPVDVTGLASGIKAVAAGGEHSCAITTAGGVKCWGDNQSGALGNASNLDSLVPVDVSRQSVGVVDIAPGYGHTCALNGAGAIKCWGSDVRGELGDIAAVVSSNVPVDVDGMGAGTALIPAEASFSTAAFAVGNYSITAEYGGDATHDPGVSSPLAQEIGKAVTNTGVVSSANPSVFGAEVTLTAAVASGAGTPTGTVTFKDGGTTLGTGTLSSGTASLATSAIGAGSRMITATYEGDSSFAASTSPALSQIVSASATTTALGVSPGASVFGQDVTLTATVSSGAGTPSGTVSFKDRGTEIGTAALSGGTAMLTTGRLGVGAYAITAHFAGSIDHGASQSAASALRVDKGKTRTRVRAKPRRPRPGKRLRLIATVAAVSPASGIPDGKVLFGAGRKTLGIATLKQGRARFRIKVPKSAKVKLKAIYRGAKSWRKSAATRTLKSRLLSGDEFQVNTHTPSSQLEPAAADLADGGFVVAWASEGQDGAGYGIYGQRFDDDDELVGEEFRINTLVADSQASPVLAGLNDGGFVAAWRSIASDRLATGLSARLFDRRGSPRSREFTFAAASGGVLSAPRLSALEDGGLVAVWASSNGDGSSSEVLAQRFNAAGAAVGETMRIASDVSGDAAEPAVAGLDDGGFAVAWVSKSDSDTAFRIHARRFDRSGKPKRRPIRISRRRHHDHPQPVLAGQDGGGFVVAWSSQRRKASAIQARLFAAEGRRMGRAIRVARRGPLDGGAQALAALDRGGFAVIWAAYDRDGSGLGIYSRRFNSSGTTRDAVLQINATTAKNQWQPSVIPAAGGGFLAVWTSQDQDGSREGIFGRSFRVSN